MFPLNFRTAALLATTLGLCSWQPALAQLQWQSTGVQQASHTEAATTTSRRRAKAPTVIAPTTRGPRTATPRAATVASKHASAKATQVLQAAASSVRQVDTAVVPACHACGAGAGHCGCGVPRVEATCGIAECCDPGCGVPSCGEPSCGLAGPCGCGDTGCGGTCGYNCGCGDVCVCGNRPTVLGCRERGAVPLILYVPPIHEFTLFGGVHAFKGALDENRDRGNFGFHEGVNAGGRMAWLPFPRLGYQIGYQAAHSQLHGDSQLATSESHTQQFVTAGLFHRKPVGLQYGVVYDLLEDERQGSTDFNQIRVLIGITNPQGHEFGFTMAKHVSETVLNNTNYQGVDQYLLYYRRHGCDGGEFRLFGGVDDDSMGILGGDVDVPLNSRWSLQSGFSYLIPEDQDNGIGGAEEAWNLGMNLVWHYGKRAKRSYKGQFRPLFNVADNGSFFVDDKP